MFENILYRPNPYRKLPLDFGQMLESLLFYQKTIAHIGRDDVRELFKIAELDTLERLLKRTELDVYLNISNTTIALQNGMNFVSAIHLVVDIEKELYDAAFIECNDKNLSRKFSKRIAPLIKIYQLPENFSELLNEQIKDKDFRDKVLEKTIYEYQPDLKDRINEVEFHIAFEDKENFKILTNLPGIGASPERLNADSVVLAMINGCEDINVMQEFKAEVCLPDFNAEIVKIKIASSIEKSIKSAKEIDVFNHYVYDNSWALREAINNRRLLLKGFLRLLDKANNYKSWLRELPDDTNLIRDYIKKVQEKTILEKLPSKAIRFNFFTGLGLIADAIVPGASIPLSTALGLLDSMVLDELYKGWKPHQFIENDLRPAIKKAL